MKKFIVQAYELYFVESKHAPYAKKIIFGNMCANNLKFLQVCS